MAFLGAGVSAPLYPLWTGLIGDLINAAASRLDDGQAETLRALASQSPEEVVEIIRTALGTGPYREVLRQVFRVRTDEETGRSWTTVGADALLRAPIASQWGDRRNLRWWNDAMPRLFSTDPADNEAIQMAYDQLSERFRAGLYVTRQNQPLLTGAS